jgi:hypothetical protein
MSHTQGSSPASGGSPVDQSCVLIERILGLSAAHKQSERGVYIDKGLYVIKQGSSYVMISVIATGAAQESALVRVTAQVVAGVRPEPQLLRQLLILNGKLRFGAFAYEPDGELILFSHALLGGSTLNANEVLAAVHDVALVADRYDDHIVARYGGRRMQDVVEESAWARLLHLDRGELPSLEDDAAAAPAPAPSSGKPRSGKKKDA